MKKRKFRYFVCDFETTVFEGQTHTEVWASASVEMFTEDVKIFHSIAEQFDYFVTLDCNVVAYYHNLKFDGSFWLSYLLLHLNYTQAYNEITEGIVSWKHEKDMVNNSFKYSISDRGQWYTIIIKTHSHIIEIRDSLKLLPFSVKKLGDSFQTKHKKLEMEYKGFRYAGCKISDEEKKYIANDVLVVKEAMEFMFDNNHDKLTIGSCCLSEYESIMTKETYNEYFPNLYEEPINESEHGAKTIGDWIRKSYKGGWCYLVKGKENKLKSKGLTADVNSLYPSMMSSESGNRFPIGKPKFWTGNMIPEICSDPTIYWFIRIKTRFQIKKGKLPFIQLKGNFLYPSTECLETSDIKNLKTGEYSRYIVDYDGNIVDSRVELTLTMTDYKLFREHYDVDEFEILDGCYFFSLCGLFDQYIEKYKKIKMESKGAMRELAKLFLNNLYGKMASSTDSSFKVAYLKDDNSVGFYPVIENDKKPGYIPVGSAITSYARNFTIRAAQSNYYGVNKRGFIYADTDSIHCDLEPEEVKGISVHPVNFCCWKIESKWDIGLFVRQKTYIEHVIEEDLFKKDDIWIGEKPESPFYNVKCAGMPEKCKNLFLKSMEGYTPSKKDKYTDLEKKFLSTKRQLTDFKVGIKIPGKLLPKRILGGTVLVDTYYEMR